MDDVAQLAARWGIDLEFIDARGRHQRAEPDTVRRIALSLSEGGDPGPFDSQLQSRRAYQGDGHSRRWLLAFQLYGVRSATNWGHGDFADLAALISLAARIGAAGIGLNPLHALFSDRSEDASPYAPNSRLFLNPLYIDVTTAPGFPGLVEAGLADAVTQLREAPAVDYSGVARVKLTALRAAYAKFRQGADEAADFDRFRNECGRALECFAAFETLRKRFPDAAWWGWPPEWRQPTDAALQSIRLMAAEEIGFHEYVQWVADRQLRHCRELGRSLGLSIGLYLDLAVGVDPGGADAWAGQGDLLTGVSIGAPPDLLNTLGQEWGVTAYNPHRLVKCDFAPLRDMLRSAMRYAGAIRLDHILGLKRLYVVPHGLSPVQGTYLRCPFESLLAVIAEESERQQCIVIGEDLGTVPEGFRELLAASGIWSYLVVLFERAHDGAFCAPERYPVNALATFSTHDLATFNGWLTGHDLRVKRAIGLDPGEQDDERERAVAALHDSCRQHGFEGQGFVAVARFLAATPSRLVAVSIEDVLMLKDQINVPGTTDQHPNWRRRLPLSIEAIEADAHLRDIADAFAQAGRANGS